MEKKLQVGTLCWEQLKYLKDWAIAFFVDRFFSNIPLVTPLLSRKLFGCGIIRTDRKGFPKYLLKPDKSMKMGDSDFLSNGEVSIITWKDRGKKSVKTISNMHDPEEIPEIQRRNKKGGKGLVKCPNLLQVTILSWEEQIVLIITNQFIV